MSPSLPGVIAVVALAVALTVVGRFLIRPLVRPEDGALYRAVMALFAGSLTFHFLLAGLDAVGIPWHPVLIAVGIALLGLAAWRFVPWGPDEPARFPSDLGWGDGVAFAAWLTFTLFAVSLWITLPDFVYHWGVKGARFALVRGIDYEYLARSWNWVAHPDYPNFVPEFYAGSALLAGHFDPAALMLWSAVWFGGGLVCGREALRRLGKDIKDGKDREGRFARQAGLAAVALGAAAFGIGHIQAGGADWLITLALLAAVPPLLAPPSRETDLQIGLIAAFACASKVEGVTLGAFLIAAQLLRRLEWRRLGPRLLRLGLPAAAVVLPWLAAVRAYHLFQEFNAGSFDPDKAAVIGPALLTAFRMPAWHGLSFLLPLLLPLLWLDRRLRPLAAVVTLQLAFYLYVYFTARVGTDFLVTSSFPRLALHLLPAVAIGAIGLDGLRLRRSGRAGA
jgi:hypothetical protein